MNDVAELAGVSPSTVSYVMTGKRPIGEATRLRVLAAADELGWQPNSLARALRSARANSLALIGPRESRAYAEVQGALLYALSRAAEERGYDLLLKAASDDPEAMTKLARSSGVDAVLLTDVLMDDRRVQELVAREFPVVLLGRTRNPDGLSWVDVDFDGAGRAAVEHLADVGHETVALFGPPPSAYAQEAGYALRTLAGARAAAEQRGVHLVAPPTTETLDGFADEVSAAFRAHPGITGVVLQYEPATPLMAQILAGLGRQVPVDVSVVAIAPRGLAAHSQPAIDYIDLGLEEMADAAVDIAVALLGGEPPRTALLPARVVAMGSVAPPPQRI